MGAPSTKGRFSVAWCELDGKTVESVPMLSRRRMRRACMADSWTLGIVKPLSCWAGLVKRRWGDGREVAEVREIRDRRAVERYIVFESLRDTVEDSKSSRTAS
jgi:hypothetical protein